MPGRKLRRASWVLVVAAACVAASCKPFRVSAGDGGPGEELALGGGEAGGTSVGPTADNDADITRYPDEQAVDHLLGVTRLAASSARTQAGGALGAVVAVLPPGASVDKIAVRRGWFLVVFIDPKDVTAGRRLLGWLDAADFVGPTGKPPAIHCELPKVAALRGGQWTCVTPAPPGSAPVPPLTPTSTAVPTAPTAAPTARPTRPLDVKQQGGACPGGYARCGAMCRAQCGRDADCGLASAHCQGGFCLGPGASPCGN
ncbi:MAG TPA: hypothetical protein VHS09_05560 [Polyangiaceae bacterium]|jgi:hypothetical protein|nr:hypothetical protein [Polyangiaceae bacterium]